MNALTVAEYKRDWFDRKVAELKQRGLKDTEIAAQMGVGRSYFSQVVNGDNVGDAVVDRMCSAFGFQYPDVAPVSKDQTIGPNQVVIDKDVWLDLVNHQKTVIQLLHRVLDQQKQQA